MAYYFIGLVQVGWTYMRGSGLVSGAQRRSSPWVVDPEVFVRRSVAWWLGKAACGPFAAVAY